MQSSKNTLDHQNYAFGNTENSFLLYFQNTDNQHQYPCKNISDSTGKEKDVETGYGYFGARYIDQDLTTLFLSVDPMADKYPSINPYAYCMWNPIKLIDPDGMDTIVSIALRNGDVSFWGTDKTSNGTFVEVYSDNNLVERYSCNGIVSIESDLGATRTTLCFSDNIDANNVFNLLIGNNNLNVESGVEWDYYQQRDGSGDLITSQKIDAVDVSGFKNKYNDIKSLQYHHFHPSISGYRWWFPSTEDQEYSQKLNIPCYLHFSTQSYRFDDIVRKYGVMTFDKFQRHIPLTIFKGY